MSRTNEEIRNEILKRKKELDSHSSKQKKVICFSALAVMCCIISVAAVIKNGQYQLPTASTTAKTTPATTAAQQQPLQNTIAVSLFEKTEKNPEADSFSQEELHHVDVVLNGDLTFRQLLPDEYSKYGFELTLTQSDFGEYLGKIVETSKNDPNIKIGSQEPSLKNSEVYYHSAKGKTALIAKNNQHCSIFVLTGISKSLAETYSIYGIESENDIAYLTYYIYGLVDDDYSQIETAKITDRNKIKSFYGITKSLTPYEVSDGISATPDWLNEAWDEYKKNPEKYNREDITVNIHLNNGMILENISYQPYLATGFVENMEPLTPEQNTALRSILTPD